MTSTGADPRSAPDPLDDAENTSPHGKRCAARSKRSGQGCKRTPIPGGTVCTMHGGAAPQVRAAAQRRLQDQLARVACWEYRLPGFGEPSAEALAAARHFRRQAD